MKRHIVLIGLPGAGKTTAGRLAAADLAAPFLDGDDLVEARAGKSVPRIFAEDGEPAFRRLEHAVVAAALAGPPAVVAPGGGWAAQPGNLDGAGNALVVHLAVAPEVAVSRVGGTDRPLLTDDRAAVMARLAAVRFPLYRGAEETVETVGRTARQVADALVQLARQRGGW